MAQELSPAAVRAGYDIGQHKSHVGILWSWRSPIDHGSHIRTRDEAVLEAEAAFAAEITRSRFVLDALEG